MIVILAARIIEHGPVGYDVFISYTHDDNRSPPEWVQRLHGALIARFNALRRGQLEVFRDVELRGDVGTSQLLELVDQVEALLCVLSPSFLESPWCRSEIDRFVGVRDGGIFTIEKLPTELDSRPGPLRSLIPYRFWRSEDSRSIELLSGENDYFRVLNRLAHDLLDYFEQRQAEAASRAQSTPVLIVADGERTPEEDDLRSRLRASGYTVYPRLVSMAKRRMVDAQRYASSAAFIVFFFGNQPRSVAADLWPEIRKHAGQQTHRIIAAMPSTIDNESLEVLHDQLLEDEDERIDIHQGLLDDLKEYLDSEREEQDKARGGAQVVCLAERRDRALASRVAAEIERHDHIVDRPGEDGGFVRLKDHVARASHIVLVVGDSSNQYLQATLSQLRRMRDREPAALVTDGSFTPPDYLADLGYRVIDSSRPDWTQVLHEFLAEGPPP
jgi:hypothetical protein